ncbi:MAG TPA: DUF1963 domain-containing protein [Bryobacteraceae bacterium]|nr:DUF1963 domain-containing protein [Bryobacteraceae bacterium]
MIARGSQKLHPELDFAAARRVFEAGAHEALEGELITSPYDVFSVEELRDIHGLREGQGFPADLFVFGKGESPRREATKVGGIPYWAADRPWPTDDEGSPLFFLAQFNFADSRDLFPTPLPGDVLLLLVEDPEDYLEPDLMRFEWLPLELPPVSHFDKSLMATTAGPFYGVIHRSADYPDSTERASDLEIRGRYNLPILNGTKIGGVPHWIQGGDDSESQFLCQLGSIQAAHQVPYPWVNQAESLGLEFDDRGIHGDSNSIVFGDMGSIYVFLDRDGSITSSFQCY